MVQVMLQRWTANPEEPTFLDRDPNLFTYILGWYRDGEIFIPETVSEEAMRREMRFFGLPDDAALQVRTTPVMAGAAPGSREERQVRGSVDIA